MSWDDFPPSDRGDESEHDDGLDPDSGPPSDRGEPFDDNEPHMFYLPGDIFLSMVEVKAISGKRVLEISAIASDTINDIKKRSMQ